MRTKLIKITQVATFGLALAFTFSCSSGGDDDGSSSSSSGSSSSIGGGISSSSMIAEISSSSEVGTSKGRTITHGIEDVTGSSFTLVENMYQYNCEDDGTLRDNGSHKYETNYSINGTTLSFGGGEFNGNSNSLIGTWNSLSLETLIFGEGYYISSVSKAEFTQNSLTLTLCAGKTGEESEFTDDNETVIGRMKVIDCGTVEMTIGIETVRAVLSGMERTFSYNGKSCEVPYYYSYSKLQMEKACTEAYNNVEDYREILNKDVYKCFEDNNFPEWLLDFI